MFTIVEPVGGSVYIPGAAAAGGGAILPWYQAAAGVTLQGAWQFKGAASFAASKINLGSVTSSGDWTTVGYTVPSWDVTNGLTFTGTEAMGLGSAFVSNQKPLTFLARANVSNVSGYRGLIMSRSTNDSTFVVEQTTGKLQISKENVSTVGTSTGSITTGTSQVYAVTYDASGNYAFYINGTSAGTGTNNVTFTGGGNIFEVGKNSPGLALVGTLQAAVIHNTALSSAQIAALSSAMAAI